MVAMALAQADRDTPGVDDGAVVDDDMVAPILYCCVLFKRIPAMGSRDEWLANFNQS